MSNPIEIDVIANIWNRVQYDVTTGVVHLGKKTPNFYLQTYRMTGDAPPTDIDEGVPILEAEIPISSVSPIDVYIMPRSNDGSVIVGEDDFVPQEIFSLPLLKDLLPIIGDRIPDFTRSTTATVVDFEGAMHTAKVDEARFEGARRVENLVADSQNLNATSWNKANVIITPNATTAPDDTLTADLVTQTTGTGNNIQQSNILLSGGVPNCISAFFKNNNSNRSALLLYDNNLSSVVAILRFDWIDGVPSTFFASNISNIKYKELDDGWYRVSYNFTPASVVTTHILILYPEVMTGTGNSVYIWGIQPEVLSGSQTGCSEYTSNGVLSYPFHGAGADGVKYFDTDRSGNPIPDATLKGFRRDKESTNLFLNSEAAVTQSITVVNGSDYTVHFLEDTGSITLSDAGTGVVSSGLGNSVTFTASSTNLICTVAGDVNKAQVELGKFPTSYIKTEATTVTRTADQLDVDNTDNKVLPNSFSMTMDMTPVADGEDYETTEVRLFGTQDNSGHEEELRTVLGSYNYFPFTGGGYYVITNADLNADIQNKYGFQLFQNGVNSDAKIFLNGVKKLEESNAQILNHSDIALNIGYWQTNHFTGNIGNIKIFDKNLTDEQFARIVS